jgi:hypothetical protein
MTKPSLEIKSQWDAWNTNLLTGGISRVLFKHLEKGEIRYTSEFKKGSAKGFIDSNYLIYASAEVSAVLLKEISKYLNDRVKRQDTMKKIGVGKEQPPVIVIDHLNNKKISFSMK